MSMKSDPSIECRHFASYTGVKLPLKLITPLADEDVHRRITYFRGYFDEQGRLAGLEKVVYGEIEFEHRYVYHADGRLKSAELREPDEQPRLMEFP
jgi:hypothetical protein